MKFTANLSMLFTEYPLLMRFRMAAMEGFDKVEIQFPYSETIGDIAEQLNLNDQQLILINTPAGNWEAGERGIACHPDRIEEFRAGVHKAGEYASALGVKRVNVLAGIKPDHVSSDEATEVFSENLSFAGKYFAERDIAVMAEGINTYDIPGFFLNHSKQAFDLIERIGQPNLYYQYDVYHMQLMEGNLINTLTEHLDQIGHIQIADVPGRHEPGTGEINFPNLFKALEAMGYSGHISLEYLPAQGTQAGLDWLKPLTTT